MTPYSIDTERTTYFTPSRVTLCPFTGAQIASSDEWLIEHNLGKMPNVTIMDSAGTVVYGEIHYINDNIIIIRFTDAFSGTAVIN